MEVSGLLLMIVLVVAAPYMGDATKVCIAWTTVHTLAACVAVLCAITLMIALDKLDGIG